MSEEQMDAILNQEAPSRDIPMKGEEAQPTPQEYSLKVDGREIKAPLDKVLQWAQMGYSYPQKAAELKAQQQKWEQERQQREAYFAEIEKKWSPYKEVDEYAAKNPQWWGQVQEAFKSRPQEAQPQGAVALPPEVQQKLEAFEKFIQDQQLEKQSLKTQEEDKQLSSEIESIRKSFPNIDFDSPDAEGKSLEIKILEHAQTMGLDGSKPGHFRAAFRDFYHDHLLGKAKEEGKELVSKEVQKRTKLGLLGESPKPTKGLKGAENVKGKSYDDLLKEALQEIN